MDERSQHLDSIMENHTPFDLNAAIRCWRNQLAISPQFRVEDVEELEGHLRESVNELHAKGLAVEESFWLATRRLGSREELGTEFSKTNRGCVWRARMFWGLLGVLAYMAAANMAAAVSAGSLFLGSYLQERGLWLGWFSVGCECAAVLGSLGVMRWVVRRHSERMAALAERVTCRRSTGLVILLGAILLSKAATAFFIVGGAKRLPAYTWGEVSVIRSWFALVSPLLVLAAIVFVYARLWPSRASRAGRAFLLLLPAIIGAGLLTGCDH